MLLQAIRLLAVLLFITAVPLTAQQYELGPDSKVQTGVPKGKITKHQWTSDIFPGTVRDYWVYVPEQYSTDKPAAVMVFQDGHRLVSTEEDQYMTPIVMDNLIHQGRMPVTIGIFISPGVLPASGADQRERYNRSFEYDGLGDRYARFLIEEILPEVGKDYNLTDDPNLRGIGGSSSGGICAFTAAWNRPDAFRRVLSFIGSYVNLRGGQIYPSLIRKSEPKPLRVFQQDGKNDLNIYSGSWWAANESMASALKFAGYEHKWVVCEEAHNNRHPRAVLPEALAWLWRDWKKPIAKPKSVGDRQYVQMFLDLDEDWETVSTGHEFTEGPAVAPNGDVYFTDVRASKIWKIATDDAVTLFKGNTYRANGLMFGPDGKLYACQGDSERLMRYGVDGSEETVANVSGCNDLVVTAKGDIYFTDPVNAKVWLIQPGKEPRAIVEGPRRPTAVQTGPVRPNGVIVSPDQSLLIVADSWSKWTWSYQIQADGSAGNGQAFYRLETSDSSSVSRADGMTVDSEGHLYVATDAGLQVCDQPGRVVAIISKPQPGPLSNAVFAGPGLSTLYVTAGDKVFRRKVRRRGVLPWKPAQPPVPGL